MLKINSVLKRFTENLSAECDCPCEDDVQAHWPKSIMGKRKQNGIGAPGFHPSHRLSRGRLSVGRRLWSTDPPLTSTPPTNAEHKSSWHALRRPLPGHSDLCRVWDAFLPTCHWSTQDRAPPLAPLTSCKAFLQVWEKINKLNQERSVLFICPHLSFGDPVFNPPPTLSLTGLLY